MSTKKQTPTDQIRKLLSLIDSTTSTTLTEGWFVKTPREKSRDLAVKNEKERKRAEEEKKEALADRDNMLDQLGELFLALLTRFDQQTVDALFGDVYDNCKDTIEKLALSNYPSFDRYDRMLDVIQRFKDTCNQIINEYIEEKRKINPELY